MSTGSDKGWACMESLTLFLIIVIGTIMWSWKGMLSPSSRVDNPLVGWGAGNMAGAPFAKTSRTQEHWNKQQKYEL